MRTLTLSECREWCAANGVALDALKSANEIFAIPPDSGQRISLIGRPAIWYSHDEMGRLLE